MTLAPRPHGVIVRAAALLTAMCVVAACSNSDPLGAQVKSPSSIVVGSGDFPESQIIAEIYAQALQANGFDIGRRMGIGSRETYIPALKDHSIDLVPEYIGNLLLYFAPDSRRPLSMSSSWAPPPPPGRFVDPDARARDRHRHRHRDQSNGERVEPEDHRRLGRAFGRGAIRGAVGVRDQAGRAARPATEIRARHPAGQLRRHRRRRRRGHRARLARRKGERRQRFHHLTGHTAGPPGGARRPGAQFRGGKHCAAGQFAKNSGLLKDVLDAVSAKLTTSGVAGLNAAVSGNSGIDPDEAARNWIRDNGFNHPIGG